MRVCAYTRFLMCSRNPGFLFFFFALFRCGQRLLPTQHRSHALAWPMPACAPSGWTPPGSQPSTVCLVPCARHACPVPSCPVHPIQPSGRPPPQWPRLLPPLASAPTLSANFVNHTLRAAHIHKCPVLFTETFPLHHQEQSIEMARYGATHTNPAKSASARGSYLRVSFKNTRETAQAVNGWNLEKAQKYLDQVLDHQRAIPFRRFNSSIGRTAQGKEFGVTKARWPAKSVKFVQGLLQNAAANAEVCFLFS